MRSTQTNAGETYSPDDGDYLGFLALLRAWVEADALPIADRDVIAFAGKYATARRPWCRGSLRTRKQWLRELKLFAGRQEFS